MSDSTLPPDDSTDKPEATADKPVPETTLEAVPEATPAKRRRVKRHAASILSIVDGGEAKREPTPQERERTAKEREKTRTRIAARQQRWLACGKRWGKRLHGIIVRADTWAFKNAGVLFELDTDAMGMTVYVDIDYASDTMEAIELPFSEAAGYYAAVAGIESFEDFIDWLHEHKAWMLAIGITAIMVQHGAQVFAVAKEVVRQQEAKRKAEKIATVHPIRPGADTDTGRGPGEPDGNDSGE